MAAAHTATAAPRAGLEHLQRPGSGQFTKSEGDPHNRISLTFREKRISVAYSSQESAAMEVIACCLKPSFPRRVS